MSRILGSFPDLAYVVSSVEPCSGMLVFVPIYSDCFAITPAKIIIF
jgi:hypothetical protein